MKTLRDTNNNNSNTTNNPTQPHFSSNTSSTTIRHNFITTNESIYQNSNIADSDATQNHRLQSQTIWRANNDQSPTSSKVTTQNSNSINPNPLASLFNGDPNQLSSMIQTYLTKFGGNSILQSDTINPLVYLQLMNANTMFMQQLSALQNNNNSNPLSTYQQNSTTICDNLPNDLSTEKRNSQVDSTIFVPKTRPMTQDEIAQHARLVYQRALQRNQLQQHNDLMKHFYQTINTTHDSNKSTDHNDVPSVPNASNIGSIGTFDTLDTMITSPSSCLSVKEPSINTVVSSVSLLSVDDTKMMSNTGSILDPGAPIFVPRQNRQKSDDDNETSSSSSDSDFNDFHYLDQFLEEFYSSDTEQDNHLIITKSLSSDKPNNDDEISNNNNNKYPMNHHVLGQGDSIEQKTGETSDEIIEQPLNEKQYSIYQLLHRYRNPRCHLVLPEWSRLSLILPNVCSMRGHTYKIKRYFAYRRRLSKDQDLTNIPVQG